MPTASKAERCSKVVVPAAERAQTALAFGGGLLVARGTYDRLTSMWGTVCKGQSGFGVKCHKVSYCGCRSSDVCSDDTQEARVSEDDEPRCELHRGGRALVKAV